MTEIISIAFKINYFRIISPNHILMLLIPFSDNSIVFCAFMRGKKTTTLEFRGRKWSLILLWNMNRRIKVQNPQCTIHFMKCQCIICNEPWKNKISLFWQAGHLEAFIVLYLPNTNFGSDDQEFLEGYNIV